MIEVTFAGAFIAGLLSFLSPCVLPLVPAYLSYISGVSVSELRRQDEPASVRRHALAQSLWFIAGFSLVFIALGASASLLGQWMLSHMAILAKVAGAIIVVFGMHYAGIIRIPLLMMDAHFDTGGINAKHGTGALILGSAFAFGWTPCIGPILGAILAIAGAQAEMTHGILLLATYSLGLAIPFLLAALATDSFLRWSQGFKSHFVFVEKLSGVLLIIVGVLIFLGSFSVVSAWLIEWFPALADLESKLTP
ncbi:cytochrome c biogenesis CcdA family protein [Mariprofundus ferrooxydans]|uniref:Cytochrome c biogenesis protein CcdA n=1 Tax=Mariprofundus ferrooxydans PV-1 TaxID=314345 RepID=Q0EWY7_9PROT|nr:cytochrome c biogenesis protein CcdA [Mariprofundus ferrooxydans]EAU53770.1 cytochrome c biogenesis protein CcdA [Mariprofundus ferrooxydans PV-1]KON47521.1 cytochrome C biogenesis protein [Mariprofundus ferrooxydans]